MLISQRIQDVLALPSTSQQILASQYAKPLGNRRQLLARRRRDFAHTSLALRQHCQSPQSRRVTHRSEYAGGNFDRRLIHWKRKPPPVIRIIRCARFDAVIDCLHLNNYSTVA